MSYFIAAISNEGGSDKALSKLREAGASDDRAFSGMFPLWHYLSIFSTQIKRKSVVVAIVSFLVCQFFHLKKICAPTLPKSMN